MRPEHQTEYIVQALRMQGAMYEQDARAFLAEHDAHVRAQVLAEVESRLTAMAAEADQYTAELENEGADSPQMYAQHIGLRRARDDVRRVRGEASVQAGPPTAVEDRRKAAGWGGNRTAEVLAKVADYFEERRPSREDAVSDFDRGRRATVGWVVEELREKATAEAATATPTDTNRRARLLHEMAYAGGRWKSGDVVRWYHTQGLTGLGAGTARHDLAVLRDSGAITQHDETGVRFYTLNNRKGGTA